MSRVKIKFPADKPLYNVTVPVRIGDINYGGHLGNDSVLSLIHEARMQLLHQWGYTELKAGGNALIMADVMIAYKAEAFYGEILQIDLYIDEMTDRSFDLLYRIYTSRSAADIEVAHAKTAMICFDYTERKIVPMRPELKNKLLQLEN